MKRYGYEIARHAVTRGDFGPLRSVIKDCNRTESESRQAGMRALSEAMLTFVAVLDCASKHVRFTGASIPTEAQVRYALSARGERLNETCQVLINAITALRRAAPKVAAGMTFKEPPESAPAAAKATPVEVVAMPARKTTSLVERNGAGDIVATTQIEKDMAA